MPKIINIKTKGNIKSLIENNFNGLETNFIVKDKLRVKRDKILNLIAYLKDNLLGYDFIYEGKINYGFRNKRIDVVIYNNPVLFLGNYSELKKADKKAVHLDQIIDLEKNKKEYGKTKICGCLFLEGDLSKNVIDNIRNLLNNEFIFLNINDNKIIDRINKWHI